MAKKRRVIIDSSAPSWAQRLEVDLNATLDGIASDLNASQPARAWVNVNQNSTQTIRDSFNVSSITDTATGSTNVNMTAGLANANYSVVGGFKWTATVPPADSDFDQSFFVYNNSASVFSLHGGYRNDVASGRMDSDLICGAVFGDVA